MTMTLNVKKFGRQLNKAAMMTDIHFGRKSNSPIHNQDCLDYIDWFCNQVRNDKTIDHICFLGDWHENRSSLNLATLKASFDGAKKLNDLGLPVFFIVGNHDLYNRHNRDIHGLHHLDELNNFIIIDSPVVYEDVGDSTFFSPFLFQHEYTDLAEYLQYTVWMGHFEFKGFVIAGHSVVMPTGPDVNDFKGPDLIFSGHYHKRQAMANVVYIGNTFPADFSDAGDNARGMCVYYHTTKDVKFTDWLECPKYYRCLLSDLLEGKIKFSQHARVRCSVDIVISFEESSKLKTLFVEKYKLREFGLEESREMAAILTDTSFEDVDTTNPLKSVDELILEMLTSIDSPQIDNELLVKIYRELPSL